MTFDNDEAVHLAHEIRCATIRTEIVYTRRSEQQKPKAATITGGKRIKLDDRLTTGTSLMLLDLCDDLLLKIMDRCNELALVNLYETCVRFNCLLDPEKKSHPYRFPDIDETLKIEIFKNKISITLIQLRKMVRLMGCHFKKLEFTVFGDEQTATNKLIYQYMQEVVKHCTNIQHVVIAVQVFSNDLISLLEPVFNNLIVLEIDDNGYSKNEVYPETDLTELLPRLKRIQPGYLLRNCMKKTWSSLEAFVSENEFDEGEEDFFTMNPQLRCLKLSYNGIFNLEAAVARLPNIEQISIHCDIHDDLDELIYLQRFEKNPEIYLEIEIGENLDVLLEKINGLKNLKWLHILYRKMDVEAIDEANTSQQQAIVSLAKTHTNLEQFNLTGLKLDQEIVVDFVRFASKLNSLRFHDCNIFATTSLIAKIVEIRKYNDEHTQKLELFVDEKNYQIDFSTVTENTYKV